VPLLMSWWAITVGTAPPGGRVYGRADAMSSPATA
jgi:hypothetical protein